MKLKEIDYVQILWIIGKITSVLTILFLGVFMLGHLISPEDEHSTGGFTPVDMVALLFFPVGFFLGNVFSLKKELLGSVIALGSMGMFYLLIVFPRASYAVVPITLILSIPAFCNLVYSYLKEKK